MKLSLKTQWVKSWNMSLLYYNYSILFKKVYQKWNIQIRLYKSSFFISYLSGFYAKPLNIYSEKKEFKLLYQEI